MHIQFNPEDLLTRDPISLDTTNIRHAIRNSRVMITGAAGSIGSELARQLCTHEPAELILIDQAETPLNELDLCLSRQFPNVSMRSYPANITDSFRMNMIFSHAKPDLIFHAAACKHVPFMENHPYEAIQTNVFGAKILADLAIVHRVRKFIFISTDKAVKPSSIMGATKRVAEAYIQHISEKRGSQTRFVITRFGNVLRSNGSFILTFERQISEGGPVTVTHPDVSRYMMTISEACLLVLEAGATGSNSAILSFDMGQPVKILDIAKRMIRLAGVSEQAIGIKYIGLRPGEKLHEALYDDNESYEPTNHPKIMASLSHDPDICAEKIIESLQKALRSGNEKIMKSTLKKLMIHSFGRQKFVDLHPEQTSPKPLA